MKYEIKNRCTDSVQFTADIDCAENDFLSLKIGLAVKWALKNNANLRGVKLRGANLRDANLSGADLYGADLRILQTDIWTCYIQREHIRIGCKYHSTVVWDGFSDDEIAEMSSESLAWWKVWKPIVLQIAATIPAPKTEV